MGENPSPLGEAFKVDDPLAPPAEAGGLRSRWSEDRWLKFVGSDRAGEGRDVWDEFARGPQLNVATNCVSVHRIYIALEPSLDGKEPTAFKAVVLS